jgi:hypothetical protein
MQSAYKSSSFVGSCVQDVGNSEVAKLETTLFVNEYIGS